HCTPEVFYQTSLVLETELLIYFNMLSISRAGTNSSSGNRRWVEVQALLRIMTTILMPLSCYRDEHLTDSLAQIKKMAAASQTVSCTTCTSTIAAKREGSTNVRANAENTHQFSLL
ncbi:MAG: hypothetical protein ACI8PT_004007, partial [Gammaproteobacteria bacterium]